MTDDVPRYVWLDSGTCYHKAWTMTLPNGTGIEAGMCGSMQSWRTYRTIPVCAGNEPPEGKRRCSKCWPRMDIRVELELLNLCERLLAVVGTGSDLDWHLRTEGYADELRNVVNKVKAATGW